MKHPTICDAVLAGALATAGGCASDRRDAGDEGAAAQSGISQGSDDGIDPSATGNDDADVLDVGQVSGASAGDGGEGGDCPCENVLDGIYVLHSTDPPAVYFYDPPANTFTPVGQLGCVAELGATANSMAIDRQGNATLNYYSLSGLQPSGRMYRAPLSNLSDCEDLGYDAQGAWFLLGMGYAVDGAGSSCDTLFVYDSDQYTEYPDFAPGGSQLARWDDATASTVPLGATAYPVAELSGTGDARLFAFATVASNQSVLVQLDKSSGAELESTPLVGLDITNAFAFAFWGGDVYFFTETSPGAATSKVTRLDYDGSDGGGLTVVNPDAGIHIAGAGVSTCASFTPPA